MDKDKEMAGVGSPADAQCVPFYSGIRHWLAALSQAGEWAAWGRGHCTGRSECESRLEFCWAESQEDKRIWVTMRE